MIVRPATLADAAGVQAIYAHHVLHSEGTFEETPPSVAATADRIAAVLDAGLPYAVAEAETDLAAFAYASPLRSREAYRYTVEDSVYVAPGLQRRGYGRAVLAAVIAACEAAGFHQMVAVIGGSGNQGSIGLHRALGFRPAGVWRAVGFKFERWHDVVHMQKALNGGADRLP